MKKIWNGLKKGFWAYTHFMGMILTFVLTFIMYFVVVPPFSLIRFSDPLRKKWNDNESYWEDKKPLDTSLEGMKRLF
jgi:hypothetical protein